MKHALRHLLLAVALHGGLAQGQNLVTTLYSANANLSTTQYFLQGGASGATATWTINPLITVTGGRFFIGSTANVVTGVPDVGTATFVVNGGGTLDINRTGTFNLRLGQDNSSEPGILIVQGGSTVRLTGTTAGALQQRVGSSIILDGIGSTFSSVGTWAPTNATSGLFTSQGGIPVSAIGGIINASLSGTVTTLTVLAAPPDPVLTIAAPAAVQSNGTPVNFSVPFTNNGATQPLTVSSVTPGGTDAANFTVNSVTSPVAPGATGSIALTFTPAGGGAYTANLTIASSDSANPSQVIPLAAAVADPALAVTPDRVDFGTLAANSGVTTANVAVTNNGGTANLNIDATLLGTADGFAITTVPGPIAPGASANVVITFNPGAGTGHFGGLLAITSDAAYNSSVTLPLVAEVTPASALPIALALENGNFNANAYNSVNSTAPNGWSSSLVGIAGNYGQLVPNVANLPALFWARSGNYLEQDLSSANAGLTANQVTGVSVSFDRAYRNDAVTSGDILVRVSLWDLASNSEIAGRDVVIEDTGVIAGTGSNQFTPTGIAFPVSSVSTGAVALRIATVEPFLAANQFNATAMFDNVSLAISGSYDPSTPFEDWALAAGLDGTPGKEDGPADDPDKDGASNLDEFAFGSEPLSGSSRGLVAALTADTNADTSDELLLTVAVRAGASFSGSPAPSANQDGVVYQIQGSTSLGTFDQTVEGPLAVPVIPVSLPAAAPSGYEYKTFRLAGSNGLPGRGFLRASVTEAP